MFILRSTHEKLLAAEKQRHADVVAQMQEQIADLRRLVFVPSPTHVETLPVRTANAILDGAEVLPNENEKLEEEMREANRILNGSFDNVEESW